MPKILYLGCIIKLFCKFEVQVMGSTINSEVGQADTEFTVTSDVKGAKTKKDTKKR